MEFSLADALQSIGLGIAFIALIVTWRKFAFLQTVQSGADERNTANKTQEKATRDANIQNELTQIKKTIDNPIYGLEALKKSTDEIKQHCATVTATYAEKIISLEHEARKRS
jgi:uncharacterized protein HemX